MISVRTLFFVAIALTLIVGSVLFWCLDPGSPSNLDFKRSGTPKDVETNLQKWGADGIEIAKRNLAVDWLFIIIYSTMWISGALFLQSRGPRLHIAVLVLAAIGIAGALCDVVEDVCLYLMLHGNTARWAPGTCKIIAPINQALFAIAALGFIVSGIVAATRARR